MVSHCDQDNAQNSGNIVTVRAIHGHGENFAYHSRYVNVIKNRDRILLSFVICVKVLPRFHFFIGIYSLSGNHEWDYPVFAFLSGTKRNNDNYHVNYL
ncbi:hypothetical protein EAE89_13030 [Photorhabdus heterorhabditis]|nr:hypothetical protein [Photorhabdus heterorhabditis]